MARLPSIFTGVKQKKLTYKVGDWVRVKGKAITKYGTYLNPEGIVRKISEHIQGYTGCVVEIAHPDHPTPETVTMNAFGCSEFVEKIDEP